MKLLTTIAAVLISISAFSQDYVEYNEGNFSRMGEILTMEQVDALALRYNIGKVNFRRGNKWHRMKMNGNLRHQNNILNLLVGTVSGCSGCYGVLLGAALTNGIMGLEGKSEEGFPIAVAGAGLCAVSYSAFSSIAVTKNRCLIKRDKEFKILADKINQAIVLEGPSAQPSNPYIH